MDSSSGSSGSQSWLARPDDFARLRIWVRCVRSHCAAQGQLGRLMDRLNRMHSLNVSEKDSPRMLYPVFQTSSVALQSCQQWAELLAHKRVFGVLWVVFDRCSNTAPNSPTEKLDDVSNGAITNGPSAASCTCSSERRKSSTDSIAQQVDEINHGALSQQVIDYRCVSFGSPVSSGPGGLDETRCVHYDRFDEDALTSLEADVRDLVRSIFWVLEKRRLDTSFEKLDAPPCPSLAIEEKYSIGVENKSSKSFKKKCIGRCRKQMGDYAFLTGLPNLALDSYSQAIDTLKSANDLLWLAASYEGWACAALVCKWGVPSHTLTTAETRPSGASSSLRRSPTAAGALRQALTPTHSARPQSSQGIDPAHGSTWNGARVQPTDMIERFRLAIECYQRFSFAARVEFECVLRAARVFRLSNRLCDMDQFLREHATKLLDTRYVLYDSADKADVCDLLSRLFAEVNLHRKAAFYGRLGVMFRLTPVIQNKEQDKQACRLAHRRVYPQMVGALSAFGLASKQPTDPHITDGWQSLQLRTLMELTRTADMAGYYDAAIRHICCVLQRFARSLDPQLLYDTVEHLAAVSDRRRQQHAAKTDVRPHTVHTHLRTASGAILPPVALTMLPVLLSVELAPLADEYVPSLSDLRAPEASVFIYTPIRIKIAASKLLWVTGCLCTVRVRLKNLMPFELQISNFRLETSGIGKIDMAPVSITLPPLPRPPLINLWEQMPLDDSASIEVLMSGKATVPGDVTFIGYTYQMLCVESQCSLKQIPWLNKTTARCSDETNAPCLDVTVTPALPKLTVLTSLNDCMPVLAECPLEITVYSGCGTASISTVPVASFEHYLELANTSDRLDVHEFSVEIRQPTLSVGEDDSPLLRLCEEDLVAGLGRSLPPKSGRRVRFSLFGLDPALCGADAKTVDVYGNEVRPPSARPPDIQQVGSSARLTSEDGSDLLQVHAGARTAHTPTSNDDTPAEECDALLAPSPLSRSLGESPSDLQSRDDDRQKSDKHDSVDDNGAHVLKHADDELGEVASRDAAVGDAVEAEGIPYTGRLVPAAFVIRYLHRPDGSDVCYSRCCELALHVVVIPAVTVCGWTVLPGEGADTRYVALDVINHTEIETEIEFGTEARFLIAQAKEQCRVPILVPVLTTKWRTEGEDKFLGGQARAENAARIHAERMRALRAHIVQHVRVRWNLRGIGVDGTVPLGALFAGPQRALRPLLRPPFSIEGVRVDGCVRLHIWQEVPSAAAVDPPAADAPQPQSSQLERSAHAAAVGNSARRVLLDAGQPVDVAFALAFKCEGVYRVRPWLEINETNLCMADFAVEAWPAVGDADDTRLCYASVLTFTVLTSK